MLWNDGNLLLESEVLQFSIQESNTDTIINISHTRKHLLLPIYLYFMCVTLS